MTCFGLCKVYISTALLIILDQVTMWKNKYEQLAKLYSQLRQEHLDLLSKYKTMQLKANSAQEAIDKKERVEREMKSKNLELADMIRERDRARYEVDRLKAVCVDGDSFNA
jgi:huntingtin-interacting protein 1-related protein